MSPDPGRRKAIERLLSRLEAECTSGDITPVAKELASSIEPVLIQRFRERKLILRAPAKARRNVARAVQDSASNLDPRDQQSLAQYLRFAIALDAGRSEVLGTLRSHLCKMPTCSTADLLDVAAEVFERLAKRLATAYRPQTAGPASADQERRLHDLNGRLVDVANGIARAVNEFSRTEQFQPAHRRLQRRERSRAMEAMQRAVITAGTLNSLDWVFDSVSFGDMTVVEDLTDSSGAFRLDFSDPKMALMRRLATRRNFIMNYAGKKSQRFLRERLAAYQEPLLEAALAYFGLETNVHLGEDEVRKSRELAKKSLISLDAEDDLLLAAGKMDLKIQAFYIVGMALRCCGMVGAAVKAAISASDRMLDAGPIPLSLITKHFDDGAEGELLAAAIDRLTISLPARSHGQLIRTPFVRDGEKVVRPFLGGDLGMCNITVREALLQGGELGKSAGAIWEDFTARNFDGTAWRVVGRGVKLRQGGETLTDVDLMILRDDLLLLVQIKALIGSADTTYDHWKNRQVIETGCAQARVAADFFAHAPDRLVSVCGKKLAQGIRIVQPVVLTNIDHLDGLSYLDVPVIGEATRKAICIGSKVDYFESKTLANVHTHVFVDEKYLTTETILKLLREPVELKIAPEEPQTVHRSDRLGPVSLLLPEFAVKFTPFSPEEGRW